MRALQLRERVEDIIAMMGRRAGDQGLSQAIAALGDGENRVFVTMRDEIQTGGARTTTVRDGDSLEGDLQRVREMATRTLRARARMRAIGGVEDDLVHAPEWSFTTHRLVSGVLRRAGADPLWMIPMHRNTGGERMLHAAIEDTGVGISGITTVAGRIHVDVLKLSGETEILIWSEPQSCGLRIEAQLPDTIVPALAGMTIGDVVRHPLLEECRDIPIVSANADGISRLATVLRVEDVQVPVRPAPEGTDLRWMGMPF